VRRSQHAVQEAPLNGCADQEEDHSRGQDGDVGINTEVQEEPQRQIHPPDHHIAVRKIDDPHDPEDEAQAQGHEAIDTTQQ
jgi:hypothetical protein